MKTRVEIKHFIHVSQSTSNFTLDPDFRQIRRESINEFILNSGLDDNTFRILLAVRKCDALKNSTGDEL